MSYTKQTWENDEAGATPISADRLNHIEDGIEGAAVSADAAVNAIASHVADPDPHPQYAIPSDLVANTRTITAGTGLTGGGNLSADRTLAVDQTHIKSIIGSTVAAGSGISVTTSGGTTTVAVTTVGSSQITDGSVGNAELGTDAVSTVKVQDDAITPAKLDRAYIEGTAVAAGERTSVVKDTDGVITVSGAPVSIGDIDESIADRLFQVGTVDAVGVWGMLGNGPWATTTHPSPPTIALNSGASTISGGADRTAKSLLVRWLGPDMIDADPSEMGGRTDCLKSAPMTTSPQIYRGIIEFETDASVFEFRLRCVTTSAMGYRVWVDDMPCQAPVTGVGSGASEYRLKVDFSAWSNPRQWRRVKIEFNTARVIGVTVSPDATIMPPGTRRKPRCAVLGDSHTEGTQGLWTWTAWQHHMGVRLDWDVNSYASGGTGYLATGGGGKVKYRDRIVDIPNTVDVIIIAGGYNDIGSFAPAAVQNEAMLLFTALQNSHPNARIIALSPFVSSGVTAADSRTAMRDAIQAACTAAGVAFIDVIGYPNRPSMITGTGKVGATNGTGNADIYVSNDGVHYSAAGYEFIGNYVASRIQEFYAAFGTAPEQNTPVSPVSGPYPFAFTGSAYRGKTKKVFAHYMAASNLVRSISNTNPDYYQNVYLAPGTTAEGGKHLPYGCWARDVPILRPVSSSSTWKQDDMEWECRQAQDAGIDGWTLLMSGPNGANQTTATAMLRAAEATGHLIVLQPDCNSTYALTEQAMADWLAPMAASTACYRIGGKVVISPHYAQRQGGTSTGGILSTSAQVTWWTNFKNIMAAKGVPVELWIILDNEQNDGRLAAYATIAHALGVWGSRSVANNNVTSRKNRIAAIKAAGLKSIQTVAFEDERPRSGVYDEARGFEANQAQWQIAIESDSDYVQLATWNDASETSSIYPSMNHGWRVLDFMTYYLAWYKDGTPPTIAQDVVFGAHRGSFKDDHGTYVNPSGTTLYQQPRADSSAAVDIIDAVWFLTSAATCRIMQGATVLGTATLSSGVQRLPSINVPTLVAADPATNPIRFEIVRSATVIASVTSPYRVAANGTSLLDDKCYRVVSSARNAA